MNNVGVLYRFTSNQSFKNLQIVNYHPGCSKTEKKIKINESSQHFFKHKLWLYLCKYLYILIYIRFLKLSQCDLCVCIYLYTSISTLIQFFKLSQSASYIFLFRFQTFLQKRICKNISRSSQMMRHKM